MEDTDAAKIGKETLQEQYNTVKKETKRSHVLQWGDLSFSSEAIGDFESGNDTIAKARKFWK